MKGIPLQEVDLDFRLFSDASLLGWGAHLEPLSLTVRVSWGPRLFWSPYQQLEMAAVFLAIHFQSLLPNKCIMVALDNSMAVSYIKEWGDPLSVPLHDGFGFPVLMQCTEEETKSHQSMSHPWESERNRRQPVQAQSNPSRGMVFLMESLGLGGPR